VSAEAKKEIGLEIAHVQSDWLRGKRHAADGGKFRRNLQE
jgi:hypothetical protein